MVEFASSMDEWMGDETCRQILAILCTYRVDRV